METNDTPTTPETTPKEFELTEQEKTKLEEYKGDNSFIQSISEKYKEYGKLTPKQVVAFRNQGDKKPSLSECPNTKIKLHQECIFIDSKSNTEEGKQRKVKITVIRQKALCMFDETNNQYAWVPSKAVRLETGFTETSDDVVEETALFLQDWFTRNDDFWKESKPFVPKKAVEPEEKIESQIEVDHQDLPELQDDDNEDDGLPF
jgi:hypothetical protein